MIESCSHPARSFGKCCRQSSDLARRIRFGLGVVQGVLAEVEGLFVDRLCEDVGTHPFGRDKERLDDELHYRVLDQVVARSKYRVNCDEPAFWISW